MDDESIYSSSVLRDILKMQYIVIFLWGPFCVMVMAFLFSRGRFDFFFLATVYVCSALFFLVANYVASRTLYKPVVSKNLALIKGEEVVNEMRICKISFVNVASLSYHHWPITVTNKRIICGFVLPAMTMKQVCFYQSCFSFWSLSENKTPVTSKIDSWLVRYSYGVMSSKIESPARIRECTSLYSARKGPYIRFKIYGPIRPTSYVYVYHPDASEIASLFS